MRLAYLIILLVAFTEGAKIPFRHLGPSFPLSDQHQTEQEEHPPLSLHPFGDSEAQESAQRITTFQREPSEFFFPEIFKPVAIEEQNFVEPPPQFIDVLFRPEPERQRAPQQPLCVPETVTASKIVTSIVPSTLYDYITTTVTTRLPVTKYDVGVATVTQTLIGHHFKTHFITSYVTLPTTYNSFQPLVYPTYISTSTTLVTQTRTRKANYVYTDTYIKTNTNYVTTTKTVSSSTQTIYTIEQTVLSTMPPETRTIMSTVTNLVPFNRVLKPQIVYDIDTVYDTSTITAIQSLKAETVIQTTSIIVPSYTTLTRTVLGIRTSTLVRHVTVTSVVPSTVSSTKIRVGISTSTITVRETQVSTVIQWSTTTVPEYVQVSVTEEKPYFVTTTVGKVVPSTIYTTRPGALVTDVHQVTTTMYKVETVTEVQRTPVTYITTTVSTNCIRK